MKTEKQQNAKNIRLHAWFVKLQFARELLAQATAKEAARETCYYSHRKTP